MRDYDEQTNQMLGRMLEESPDVPVIITDSPDVASILSKLADVLFEPIQKDLESLSIANRGPIDGEDFMLISSQILNKFDLLKETQ